jgi:DNA mismatch repair ATPase MutL
LERIRAVQAAEDAEHHQGLDAQEEIPAAVAHLPGLAPVAPSPDSVWRRLVPLGVAPEGYLCCRDGQGLALVHLRAAQRAILLKTFETSPASLRPQALMMPPTWIPDGSLAAAVDDYLIETAQNPSPWGVTLEAVGPGHFVVMAVPAPLAPYPAAQVAESLLSGLTRQGLGCHQGFEQSRPKVLAAWIDGVLEKSSGAQQGSAAVWGPSFLQRLHGSQVAAGAPVLVHLSAADVLTLK